MSQIKPIKLPNGKVIMMEVDEDITLTGLLAEPETYQEDGGLLERGEGQRASEKLQDLVGTLESMVAFIPSTIKRACGINVDNVILRFGIKVGGEAGIPYITKGSMEGNIGIEVECNFPKEVSTSVAENK